MPSREEGELARLVTYRFETKGFNLDDFASMLLTLDIVAIFSIAHDGR